MTARAEFLHKKKSVFIIAEISANHRQKISQAIKLIRAANRCGVDAVKFQAYMPNTITIDSKKRFFRIHHPVWGGQTLYQLYQTAYTPWSWFKTLKKVADDEGLMFFATAFDRTAVDMLESIRVPIHKIASQELVDLPLVEYMARTRKPMLLSTGMATLPEIREAVTAARRAGAHDIALLKCVSSYPADPRDMNLKTIEHMRKALGLPIGLSDHSLGIGIAIAAVSLGASIIEKHLTLDRSIKTPDGFFSLEPVELKEMVKNIRIVEKALGRISYGPTLSERKSLLGRRSLFVVKDMYRGEIFTEDNVRSIRPSNGLPPKVYYRVIGKHSSRSLKAGTPLALGMWH